MVRKSQKRKKSLDSSKTGKKNSGEQGQNVHVNKYASDQKLDKGGIKRTISVGKKQRRRGQKKKMLLLLKRLILNLILGLMLFLQVLEGNIELLGGINM